MPTTGGRSILSVSLFQDIGGIAILTLLPLLAVQAVAPAGASSGTPGASSWQPALLGLSMVTSIVLGAFGLRVTSRP